MADRDLYNTILPAGTVITASGNSGPLTLGTNVDPTTLDVVVNITAVSGTSPTITFKIQRDADAEPAPHPPVSYAAGTSSAALTAVGRTVISAPVAVSARGTNPRYYRLAWVVTGTTPSFTLGAYGE